MFILSVYEKKALGFDLQKITNSFMFFRENYKEGYHLSMFWQTTIYINNPDYFCALRAMERVAKHEERDDVLKRLRELFAWLQLNYEPDPLLEQRPL